MVGSFKNRVFGTRRVFIIRSLAMALLAFVIVGCERKNIPKHPDAIENHKKPGGLVGRWVGRADNGDRVTFTFKHDNSVIWDVDSKDLPGSIIARYEVDYSTNPVQLNISNFDLDRLRSCQFLGIIEFQGTDTIKLFGQPTAIDDRTVRPKQFGKDALVLTRQHEYAQTIVGRTPEEKRKIATLAVWNEFIKIGNDAKNRLEGKQATKEQIAQELRSVSLQLSNLPALNVEPELMTVIGKIIADTNEIAAVCALMSERQQFGYQLSRTAESFIRGPVVGTIAVTKEELALDKRDKDKWDQIDERMRKNLSELQELRVRFTGKFGIEFPNLGAWR